MSLQPCARNATIYHRHIALSGVQNGNINFVTHGPKNGDHGCYVQLHAYCGPIVMYLKD